MYDQNQHKLNHGKMSLIYHGKRAVYGQKGHLVRKKCQLTDMAKGPPVMTKGHLSVMAKGPLICYVKRATYLSWQKGHLTFVAKGSLFCHSNRATYAS